MARSSVLGKRKIRAESHLDASLPTVETRKRRLLRSSFAAEENDENTPPETIVVAVGGSDTVLEEGSIRRITDYGDDNTPCRRREKRGKNIILSASTTSRAIDASGRKETQTKAFHNHVLEDSENIVPSQLATPKTPRHRDALSTTATPKQQVRVFGRVPLTPKTPRTPNGSAITVYNTARQLFARSADNDGLVGRESERETIQDFIRTGVSENVGRALYISGPPGTGKSAFTNSITEKFRGLQDVRLAYVNCMSVRNSRDLFTRLLEELATEGDATQTDEDMQVALKSMFVPKKQTPEGQQPMYLVTLDEVDNLLALNVETLYTLFEWALDKSSNIILIGIANALDLTDRFLPRLKAKNLRPQLLPFVPYTAPQIASVITSKLQSVLPVGAPENFVPFVQAPAIQLCSKKVASQTGDLRKAFDIIRRAIDLVESEVRAKYLSTGMQQQQQQQPSTPTTPRVLGENLNLASPKRQPSNLVVMSPPPSAKSVATALANLTPVTAPRASMVHVSKVTASAFGNGTATRLKTLNLQQKAALCAIVAHTNRVLALAATSFSPLSSKLGFHQGNYSSSAQCPGAPMTAAAIRAAQAPTVRQLYAVYVSLCRRDGALATLTSTEFADVVASLEGLGLVVEERNPLATPRKNKGLGVAREEKRVRGCVAEREVEASLEGTAGELLRGLLKGEQSAMQWE